MTINFFMRQSINYVTGESHENNASQNTWSAMMKTHKPAFWKVVILFIFYSLYFLCNALFTMFFTLINLQV